MGHVHEELSPKAAKRPRIHHRHTERDWVQVGRELVTSATALFPIDERYELESTTVYSNADVRCKAI